MDNIAELVLQARGGDGGAFAKLYQATFKSEYYLAMRIAGNENDALDIVQDSYIKAFTSLESLKKPESFLSWMNHITANKGRDFLRRNRGVLFENSEQEEAFFGCIEEPDSEFLPQELVDREGTSEMINEIVDSLPEAQRMAVLLYYFNETPMPYIAKMLGCTEGTVKSRLFAARKKIKERVEVWEKNGVKLYGAGVSAVPVLALLLRNASKNQLVRADVYKAAFSTITNGIKAVQAAGTAQAAAALKPNAGVAAKSATKAAAASAKTGGGFFSRFVEFSLAKKIACLACAAVILGGSAAGIAVALKMDKPGGQEDASSADAVGENAVQTESSTWEESGELNEYASIEYLCANACKVKSNSGLYGLIDCKGDVIAQPNYSRIDTCSYGIFRADHYIVSYPGDTYQLYYEIDVKTGRVSDGDDAHSWSSEFPLWDSAAKKYMYYVGEPDEYFEGKNMEYTKDGMFCVYDMSTKKWGYVDRNYNFIVEPKYLREDSAANGLAAVCDGSKWGYIDEKGNIVIPFEYDACNPTATLDGRDPNENESNYDLLCRKFDGKYVAVKKGGKMGIIDQNNNAVAPFEYDIIMQGKDGVYIAQKNGRWGFIKIDGAVSAQQDATAAGGTTASATTVAATTAATTSASKSPAEEAVQVFLDNSSKWKQEDTMSSLAGYFFFDLDMDGTPELISTLQEGSGIYSQNHYYKISSNGNSVSELNSSSIDDEEEFDVINDYSQVRLKVYYCESEKKYYCYCWDTLRVDNSNYGTTYGILNYNKASNSVSQKWLFAETKTTYLGDEILNAPVDCYYKYQGNNSIDIDADEYSKIKSDFFNGKKECTVKYKFIDATKFANASKENQKKQLLDSYIAFSCTK